MSWEYDCGNTNYPAVYNKVSAVWDWILYYCSAGKIPKGIIKADALP
jgi:secreted trypsin-like serine protease